MNRPAGRILAVLEAWTFECGERILLYISLGFEVARSSLLGGTVHLLACLFMAQC